MSMDPQNMEKVLVQLNAEQKQLIAEKFGQEFADRVQGIEVDKVAQFLRTNLRVN